MSGKSSASVITDGDLAMKNVIRKVFPNAHHRLCAWHLLRNATSNVKNPNFVSRFRHCMLGDFDVEEFNRRWDKLVADFGLEENVWVLELYEKRRMWATAYIRGNFFAGFRTTSRCEGLHSEFGKYVNYRNNLVEFLQHFFRWVGYMRFREIETDFSSLYGEPVLQTQFESLERSAAHLYTKEVFKLFRPLLERACTCNVVGTQRTASRFIYTVCQYCREGYKWHVSFYESSLEFKCTCQKFESLGIPCEHVIRVLVHLNIVIIPECVVLKRWTKAAKDSIGVINSNGSTSRDSGLWFLNLGLVEHCKDLVKAAYECGKIEHMRKTIDIVTSRTKTLKCIKRGEIEPGANVDQPIDGSIRDPARVRSKGRGGASSSLQNKAKKMKAVQKPPTCGICRGKGHKRHICPVQRDYSLMAQERVGSSDVYGAGEFVDDEFNFTNIDLVRTKF